MKIRDMCDCYLFQRVQVNEALQEYTSVSYCTTDQHNDISLARQERDTRDTHKVLEYLQSKTPFDANDSRLDSIDTGVIASCSVNLERAVKLERRSWMAWLAKKCKSMFSRTKIRL